LKPNFRHIFRFSLFFVLISNVLDMYSQYQKDWAKQFGGDRADYAYTGIQDSEGRFVFAGKVVKKQTDTWVLVTDSKGSEVWGKTYDDSYTSGANQVIETSDGNYLLAGFVQKKKRDRNSNGYLMKITKQGKPVWQKRFGGDMDDVFTDVVETPDGGFVAVGYTFSNEDEQKAFWVVSADKSGNLKKEVQFGDTDEDCANAVIRTFDGNYVACGYAMSGAGKNMRIIKFTEDCEVLWDMPSEYEDIREMHDLIELNDSTLAAVGTERVKGLDYDGFMLRFQQSGDSISSHRFGLGAWEEITCCAKTFDGNLVLGGFEKAGSDFSDFWMRKVSYDGKELYFDTYRRSSIDFPEAIFEAFDNGIIMTGHTWHIQQGWDYAVLKYRDANKTDVRFKTPEPLIATSPTATYEIQACITSFTEPLRADVIVNGVIQVSDAYSSFSMSEQDCMFPVITTIKLKPGMNKVTVAVKDKRGNIVSADRVVYYIPASEMSW